MKEMKITFLGMFYAYLINRVGGFSKHKEIQLVPIKLNGAFSFQPNPNAKNAL